MKLIFEIIFIKYNWVKSQKRLNSRKLNLWSYKIIDTITNNYENGIYSFKVDENFAGFIEGEELIAYCNEIILISEEEWNILYKNRFNIKN